MNGDHDFTVNVIVCVWVWQDDLEFRVVSDVKNDFGGDVWVVDDCNWELFLVADCHTLEVDGRLFNVDVWDNRSSFNRQS